MKASLNWLLVFFPITLYLNFFRQDLQTWTFICACLTIIPLAGLMGHATENLASKLGEGVGGLLNATFGNAAELIIAIVALREGMFDVVKASLTGSIIGNILLVLGLSFVCGGARFSVQNFNTTAARNQSTMLLLAAAALIMPAVYHFLATPQMLPGEKDLSFDISIILILIYFLSLVFSLKTHAHLFAGEAVEELEGTESQKTSKALMILLVSTALVAWVSEMLIGSVEHAAHTFGMSNIFVGVIVVAIVGNAAEHSSAVLAALKNRMDLSVSIAVGSSVQIALFVAPLLVVISHWIAPQSMDLVFTPLEVFSVSLAVLVAGQTAGDGKSNWFEGAQLLSLYAILGVVFYFMP